MKPKHLAVFISLGVFWSSSFLLIKIVLEEFGPIILVTYRSMFGMVVIS